MITNPLPKYLVGSRWRDHSASVRAILGADTPPVESHGSEFKNFDRWVGGLFLIQELSKMKGKNIREEIFRAIDRANNTPSPQRKIVVAETPDALQNNILSALIGGCYHEAWHSLYSHRTTITTSEANWIADHLEPLLRNYTLAPNVASVWGYLWNLLEDIRIEKLGCKQFVGTYSNMCHLQDFILDQEEVLRANTKEAIKPDTVLLGGMSIKGLGYDTPKCKMRLQEYETAYPDIFKLLDEDPEIVDILEKATTITTDKLHVLELSLRLLIYMESLGVKPQGKNNPNMQKLSDLIQGMLNESPKSKVKVTFQVLNSGSALEQAIKQAWTPSDLRKDESPWHPYSTQDDQFKSVTPSRGSVKPDLMRLRHQSNTLRLRLSTLFKMRQQVQEIHGLPEGDELSEDFMVNSYVELRHGFVPSRPWKSMTDRMEVTIDAVTVLDQSGSMMGQVNVLRDTTLMINDALSALQAKTFILGFESGVQSKDIFKDLGTYHRYDSTNFNIFKTWEMPWEKAQNNLTNINISGSTPMSDGIQLGLSLLRKRTSRFRFLFVVTDGHPDYPHQPVVNRQIRLAQEAGYFMVGIGIGDGAKYVQQLFPHHVWVPQIDELANACAFKLAHLLEPHITLWDTSVFQYGAGKR